MTFVFNMFFICIVLDFKVVLSFVTLHICWGMARHTCGGRRRAGIVGSNFTGSTLKGLLSRLRPEFQEEVQQSETKLIFFSLRVKSHICDLKIMFIIVL